MDKQLEEARDRMMHTLGILNNGKLDLDEPTRVPPKAHVVKITTDKPEPVSQTVNVTTSPSNNSKFKQEYLDLLREFSKFRGEVKETIQAFNQNIYGLQKEVVTLRETVQHINVKHQGMMERQESQFKQMENQISATANQNNIQNTQPQMTQQVPQQNVQQASAQQQAPAQAPPKKQEGTGHPRTGGYSSNDVKIEDIFYCGNK